MTFLISCSSRAHRNRSTRPLDCSTPYSCCTLLLTLQLDTGILLSLVYLECRPRRIVSPSPRGLCGQRIPRPCRGVSALDWSFSVFPNLQLSTLDLPSFLSPSAATLMDLPASVANKRLTFQLNSLDATLTKNTGGGQSESDFFIQTHLPSCVRSSKFRIR